MQYKLLSLGILSTIGLASVLTYSAFNTTSSAQAPAHLSITEASPVPAPAAESQVLLPQQAQATPFKQAQTQQLSMDLDNTGINIEEEPVTPQLPSEPCPLPLAEPPAPPQPPLPPATQPSETTSTPPATKPEVSPEVKPADVDPEAWKVLGEMEKAGDPKQFRTYEAKIKIRDYDGPNDNAEIYRGKFSFLNDAKKPKLHVHFKIQLLDVDENDRGTLAKQHKTWVFDGQNFAEINIDWKKSSEMGDLSKATAKSMRIIQVVKPGENINPLELGKSPIPMPIGQKRAEVLKLFKATVIPPAPNVRQRWVQLKLEPLSKKAGVDFTEAHFYLDPITWLPQQVEVIKKSKSGKSLISKKTITLSNAVLNGMTLDDINIRFNTMPPADAEKKGWTIIKD